MMNHEKERLPSGKRSFSNLNKIVRPGSGGRRCGVQLAVSDPQNHLQLVSSWVRQPLQAVRPLFRIFSSMGMVEFDVDLVIYYRERQWRCKDILLYSLR